MLVKKTGTFLIVATLLLSQNLVIAEVVASSDTHYVLRHKQESVLPAEDLWQRLIKPESWWHPDHTYSGDAKNLSLELGAGGLWREDWSEGSVVHGRVMLVQSGKVLRMEAPFGPLQGVGAYVVWTITVKPDEGGSVVVFEETAIGPQGTGLDKLAPAVNGVKSQALQRLTSK